MKKNHVLSICNALVDVLIEVSEDEFRNLGIERGIMHLVDHQRQEEILSRFAGRKSTIELGGSAMNTTRTLAALGIPSMFFGTVGRDSFGDNILRRMKELDIASRVEITDEPTGSCLILITPDGERTMNTHLGASCHYHEDLIPLDDIKSAKILHFTGYQWSTPHQRRAVEKAIETAMEFDTLISFDVADPFVVRLFRDDFQAVIRNSADIVFANAQELHDLYGVTAEEAARKISDADAIAVIKLGSKGALICENGKMIYIDPVATKVVDTTAAGDMFAAGFLYGYLKNLPHDHSGKIAATLASSVISVVGAVVQEDVIHQVRVG